MSLNHKKMTPADSHPGLPLDPDATQPGVSKWPPHFTPSLQLVVFIGGFFGTFVSHGVINLNPSDVDSWPVATFIVNIIGAFMLGLLLQTLFHHGKDEGRRRLLRLGIGTGFIGALTTYSSLAVSTNLLLGNNEIFIGLAYAFTSIILGLVMCAAGIYIAGARHGTQKVNL